MGKERRREGDAMQAFGNGSFGRMRSKGARAANGTASASQGHSHVS